MSIFPTKILLATDGSDDAQLASWTAVDLAKSSDSELHLVYVEPISDFYSAQWEIYDAELPTRLNEAAEEEARSKLGEQAQRIRVAGGQIAGGSCEGRLPRHGDSGPRGKVRSRPARRG